MLTYRHADATAYLDVARGHEKSYHGILLCESHASRFTAPVGWTTIDRRGQESETDSGFTVSDAALHQSVLVDDKGDVGSGSDLHAD